MAFSISSIHRTLTECFARKNANDTPAKQQKSLLSLVAESLKTCFIGRPSFDCHRNDAIGSQPTLRDWPQFIDPTQAAGMNRDSQTMRAESRFAFPSSNSKADADNRLQNILDLHLMTLLGRRKVASEQEKRPDGLIPLPPQKRRNQNTTNTLTTPPSFADWHFRDNPTGKAPLNKETQQIIDLFKGVIDGVAPEVQEIFVQFFLDKCNIKADTWLADLESFLESESFSERMEDLESFVFKALENDHRAIVESAFDLAYETPGISLKPYLNRLADFNHPYLPKTKELRQKVFMEQPLRRKATA